jgi:cyanate lyase
MSTLTGPRAVRNRSPIQIAKFLSGLTFKQIAAKLGVHHVYIQSVIAGRDKPSADLERRLWDLLSPGARPSNG